MMPEVFVVSVLSLVLSLEASLELELPELVSELAESVLSVSSANNLVVVKTLSGSANVAAEALDSMHWPEVLGTLAGDNTILLIIRSNEEVPLVTSRIHEMMK